MRTYKVFITSNINQNVEQIAYFDSTLNEEILLDILVPITPYKLTIKECTTNGKIIWNLEDVIKYLSETKLTTKVARNVTKVSVEQIATFEKKPNLNLNIWEGDSGEIRTYVNNKYSVQIINTMFPVLFKTDIKSNKAYYPGKLMLNYDPVENSYILIGTKSIDTVIYEEITLEK